MGSPLGPAGFDDAVDSNAFGKGGAAGLLFQDQKKALQLAAERERELIEPNSALLEPPNPKRRFETKGGGKAKAKGGKAKGGGKAKAAASGGGGFGGGQKSLTPAEQATALRADTVGADGICLVEDVLSKESAATLLAAVQDELARSYAAVERDPESCLGRFNVPAATFDPLRGYLLLPLRDEASVEAGLGGDGVFASALSELLEPGSKLGDLFAATCGGTSAEWYDLVALRTEAGANRQPIHFDTPYQKVPGLFCAFIALHDVRYSQGTTVFLPGTHLSTRERKAWEDGAYDGRREEMLSSVQSRFSLLKAGDVAFFDMRTLHAGTANFAEEAGGGQRLLFILTFRNRKAKQELGHAPNLRPHYRNRGITLEEMRVELGNDEPFAGAASDGLPFGDGLS